MHRRLSSVVLVTTLASLLGVSALTGCRSSPSARLDQQIASLRTEIQAAEHRRDIECLTIADDRERAACVREAQKQVEDLQRQVQTLEKQRDEATRPADLPRPQEPGRI